MSSPNPKHPESPGPPPSEKLAEAPFDDARADLILQSSDNVHFRVFKIILSLASLVFADMFSLPSPPSQNPHDEVQVVPLSEHSATLDVALRHLYPVRPPTGDALHYASILTEFARKYQVEALDKFIADYLTESVQRDPVGVYAIAVTYECNSIGAIAARTCLNLPASGLQSPHLRCATAEHISELHVYRVACGEAASALALSDRTWLSSWFDNNGKFIFQEVGSTCRCSMPDLIPPTSDDHGPLYKKLGPRCLWNFLYRSAPVLAHHPTIEAITKEDFVLKSIDCPTCATFMRGRLLEISVGLGREVKNVVERVPLPKAISVGLSSAATTTN